MSYKVFASRPELVHGQRKSSRRHESQSLLWMLMLEGRAEELMFPLFHHQHNATAQHWFPKCLLFHIQLFFSITQSLCRFFQFYLMQPQNLHVCSSFNIFPVFLLPLEILHLSHTDVTVFWVICCNSILHSELWLLFCSFIPLKVQHFKCHIKDNSHYYCLLCADPTVKICLTRYNNLGNT